MILNTLFCDRNTRCYFLAFNVINKLTEEVNLDLKVEELEDGSKTNLILSKDGSVEYFRSNNPLKIVDFLNGFKTALDSKNKKNKTKKEGK